jgi:hypothetical protein
LEKIPAAELEHGVIFTVKNNSIFMQHFQRAFFVGLLVLNLGLAASAQNVYTDGTFQFLSFQKIPTWAGVATDWDKTTPQIHLFDHSNYSGHASYVSKALKTGISFTQFQQQVKKPNSRKYVPFFLFDLRGLEVKVEGSEYQWAVRIEDYRYEDNAQQMEATCLRLMNEISSHIEKQTGQTSKGIIILATKSTATPNSAIAPAMSRNGFPSMTRSELLANAGGKKVEILNAGIGIGYLRFVKEGDPEFHPSPHDILIYESLPARVPPVSGIITLAPQTPLSHINLLAKNRGTINLYTTDLKYLRGAADLIGELVKVDCSESEILISPISEIEAEKFWADRVVKVDIPTPATALRTLVDLNANGANQSTIHIGAKASNYALIRQKFPALVRSGYAIPFGHYVQAADACGADFLIQALIDEKPCIEERNKQLLDIRETILSSHLNPSLIPQINEVIKTQFNNKKIRLRSSTNCEDLPQFNGAGLYLSKGFRSADGDSVLEGKILQVYASLWTPIAFAEREFYFIDHAKVGMAILINEAYPNEYANGVALTSVDKNKISIHINSQYGENAVTNPENGQIPESILYESSASDEFEIRSKSNIHDVFLQDSLTVQLSELKTAILDMHHVLTNKVKNDNSAAFGVDIEFKIILENGVHHLYIKQARLLRSVLPE